MFFAGQSNPQNAAPRLVVRHILPVNPPTAVAPAPGATVNTLTPSLWAATTDPDGDAVNWYGYDVVDSGRPRRVGGAVVQRLRAQ